MSKHGPRVRVTVDDLSMSARRQSKDRIDAIMRRMFKKACDDYGIMQMIKEQEHFVSKSEKRRRKKLRAKIACLKGITGEQQYNRFNNKEWESEY